MGFVMRLEAGIRVFKKKSSHLVEFEVNMANVCPYGIMEMDH